MTDALMASVESCKHLSKCPRSEPALSDHACTCGVDSTRTEAEARIAMLPRISKHNGMITP